MSLRLRCLIAALVAGPLGAIPAASADDKKVCVDAYVKAQRLRQESKLRAARVELLACASTKCPASLQQDCTQWNAEVESSMPTVVIDVKGPDGRDAADVKVAMDGEPLVSKLEGAAIAVDPGAHTFRFQLEGADPVEQSVVIRVGDKNRRLSVDLSKRDRAPDAAPKTAPAAASAPDTERPIPPLVFVFAGLAVVGGAGFTFFALRTDSQVSDLDDAGCKPGCAQGDVDDAKTMQTLGYVSLGVTAVGLGAAAVFFFTRPERPVSARTATLLNLRPTPGGAIGGLGTRF